MPKLTQEELLGIFNELKPLLQKYEKLKNTISPRLDLESRYDLWSEKDIEAFGRKRKEMFFSGLIIQSNYVGFYFMPIYVEKEMKTVFEPELLNCLKGKSCFHIKKLDKTLKSQIKTALAKGYKLYQERGWV